MFVYSATYMSLHYLFVLYVVICYHLDEFCGDNPMDICTPTYQLILL